MSEEKRAIQTRVSRDEKIQFDVAASEQELSEAALLRRLVRQFLKEREESEGNSMKAMIEAD